MDKWNYAVILMGNEDGQNGTVAGVEPNIGGDKIVKGSRMRIIVMLETMGAQGWELAGLQEVGSDIQAHRSGAV